MGLSCSCSCLFFPLELCLSGIGRGEPSVAQSCPTLATPGSSVHGLGLVGCHFLLQGIFPTRGSSSGLCDPMDCSLPGSSCVAGGFFTELGGKPGGTTGAGFPLPRAPLRGLVGA